MGYLVVGFFGLVVGIGIGMLWNKDEIKREVELRKKWERVAMELKEKVVGKMVWLRN